MRSTRRTRMIRATATLVAALPCAGTALAQTSVRQAPLTLSAQARYDSNVAGGNAQRAAARNLTPSDVHFRLAAEAALAKRIGVFNATLSGLAGYNLYARNTRLNREQIALNGLVSGNLLVCQVDLSGGWYRQQSDLNDIGFFATPGTGGGNGTDLVRNVENVFNYGAQVGCGGAIGIRPVLGVKRETGTNSAPGRKFSDFERMDYTASLQYSQPVLGTLSLVGTLQDVSYPNRRAILGAGEGYQSKSGGIRFERRLGAFLMGVVQVNYTDLRPRRAGVESFSGVTYSGDVTATFADRLQLHALVSRDTRPSLQSDGAYTENTAYGLDATYAASQRLSFGLGAAYRKRRNPGAGLLPGIALTDDSRKTFSGNARLRANDRLSFALEGNYVKRDSSVAFYDSDNTGVSVSAKFGL